MTAPHVETLEHDIDVMRDVYMTKSQREAFDRIAAIALMRGQSEKPRAYFCPMDYGPGMLMHNDETATAMMAYFIPKGQVFIPLYEGQSFPAQPKDSADEQ